MQLVIFSVFFVPTILLIHTIPFLIGKLFAKRGTLEVVIICAGLLIIPFAINNQVWALINLFFQTPEPIPQYQGSMVIIQPLTRIAASGYRIAVCGLVYNVILHLDAFYPIPSILGITLSMALFTGRSHTASRLFFVSTFKTLGFIIGGVIGGLLGLSIVLLLSFLITSFLSLFMENPTVVVASPIVSGIASLVIMVSIFLGIVQGYYYVARNVLMKDYWFYRK